MNADYCPFCGKVYKCGEPKQMRTGRDAEPGAKSGTIYIKMEACEKCMDAFKAAFRKEADRR